MPYSRIRQRLLFLLLILSGGAAATVRADEQPARIAVRTPQPYQVIQRQGFDPRRAHEHEPGGPILGYADVSIAGAFPEAPGARPEYRLITLGTPSGKPGDWAPLNGRLEEGEYRAKARVPAGGWYRLEVRVAAGERSLAEAHVEPFGVGEVLVIAGQSYAAGANDELLKVTDPRGRVSAFDPVDKTWRVAHDPQPRVGDGGTIWPPLGDLLVGVLGVPVGFVNVAVGGTASRQWVTGEALYENLAAAGKTTGRFRAVLWQQGESDVIENVTTATYVERLTKIRASLVKSWGFEPPWLPAKSTLHPTVYNKPEGEGQIRSAIDALWKTPGFRPGPDTDILGGENRGGIGTRRHFSGIGQRRAALLWFAALWPVVNQEPGPK